MSPEQRRELIKRAVADAPPLSPEVLADLRELLPPVPVASPTKTSRLEPAA